MNLQVKVLMTALQSLSGLYQVEIPMNPQQVYSFIGCCLDDLEMDGGLISEEDKLLKIAMDIVMYRLKNFRITE